MSGLGRTAAAVLLLTLPFAAGCRQAQGEKCEVNSDCKDNLICVLGDGGMLTFGGFCLPPILPDLSVPVDAQPPLDTAIPPDDGVADQALPGDFRSDGGG